ncbi:MAG: MFS transporter [Anaerolineaceae bacterium]|nr:MFS transporter [Anaerolineaceae bacterium]
MKQNNRRSRMILFATMFIVMVGFGIIMPILPYYAENLGASATQLGLLTATYATLQFLFAPFWGRMSDKIGRKPLIIWGTAGFAVSFIIFGFSTKLWMLFAARAFSGLISSATMPAILAYISDTTSNEERGEAMAQMGAAMGLGMIFGPVIGGFLGEVSPTLPFFVAGVIGFGVSILTAFVLPESLSDEIRTQALESKNQPNSFFSIVKVLGGPLAFLMGIAFLTSFGMSQLESTGALFYERRFGAGEAEMGVIFMVMGIASAITQGLFVGRAIRTWGEERSLQISLILTGIAYFTYIFISNIYTAILAVVLVAITSSLLRPALNSMVSKMTPSTEQGVVMGVVNSYNSLGRMFGPVVGGMLFDNLGIQGPFISAAIVHVIVGILALFLFSNKIQKTSMPACTEAD